MAGILDSGKPGLIYSIDLSAAFDLLMPDKFHSLFKDKLSKGLMFCLMDFLQDRTFHIDIDGVRSSTRALDRGCVQGSALGPKLFSIYVGGLEQELVSHCPGAKVISFADDTYVIIGGNTAAEVKQKAEHCLNQHITFLKNLGMVVNESKTELMWITKVPLHEQIKVGDLTCTPVLSIKALGIKIDHNLSWDTHAQEVIVKGKRLLSVFGFLRKYMTEKQFIKLVTANFYNAIFYASSVWLPCIKAIYKTKLTSLHFRMLRSACKDYTQKISRNDLTNRCKKATPMEWAKFTTVSVAMKVVRDKLPVPLHFQLMRTFYTERRNAGRGFFYDASKTKPGRQSLENRFFHKRQISEPWSKKLNLTNDYIRVLLKRTFFSCYRVASDLIIDKFTD
jgi:hypothetical protein